MYIALNTYWEDVEISLPVLPVECGLKWYTAIDTFEEESFIKGRKEAGERITVRQRSVMVFCAQPLK